MSMVWFYDRFGSPEILFIENTQLFINKNGKNLGFVKNNVVYNYKGIHRGWLENGIIRDLNGFCLGFSRGYTDSPSPITPIPQIPPIKPIPQIPTTKPIPQIPRLKPIKKFSWSQIPLSNVF